ncbi:MAG TPA: hypothetical protein VM884_00070 [Flavisolibacter sp.]|jgi:hypothetical protein|nr:hypothetical protein [Flavisolibacter sp.]
MKQRIHFISKGLILIMTAVFFQGFSAKPGGDFYRIFLNDKMVVEQFLTQPQGSSAISLNTSNGNDHLFIHFSHCGVAGKERTITLKDEKGKPVKVWRFADSKSTVMQLPVKEIATASGKMISGTIYYASKEKPSSQLLTRLDLKKPVVAKL